MAEKKKKETEPEWTLENDPEYIPVVGDSPEVYEEKEDEVE